MIHVYTCTYIVFKSAATCMKAGGSKWIWTRTRFRLWPSLIRKEESTLCPVARNEVRLVASELSSGRRSAETAGRRYYIHVAQCSDKQYTQELAVWVPESGFKKHLILISKIPIRWRSSRAWRLRENNVFGVFTTVCASWRVSVG